MSTGDACLCFDVRAPIMFPDELVMNHFQTHGWVRIEGAFGAQKAAAMRDVVWRALATVAFQRDDPTTWRKERPDHLQHLKSDPVFRAVGSHLTLAAIDRRRHPHASAAAPRSAHDSPGEQPALSAEQGHLSVTEDLAHGRPDEQRVAVQCIHGWAVHFGADCPISKACSCLSLW